MLAFSEALFKTFKWVRKTETLDFSLPSMDFAYGFPPPTKA